MVGRGFLQIVTLFFSYGERGRDALEQMQQAMPDAILFDFHMPGMGTVEFLTSLRTMTINAKRPVVIYCTTENDTADITRMLAAGADDYVIKPFDRESLRSKMADAGLI
jgi:two-component system chemotaxis response regulator CheY